MENQSKDLENMKIEKDSMQTTLKEIDANYWTLKVEKDAFSIEHIEFQKN